MSFCIPGFLTILFFQPSASPGLLNSCQKCSPMPISHVYLILSSSHLPSISFLALSLSNEFLHQVCGPSAAFLSAEYSGCFTGWTWFDPCSQGSPKSSLSTRNSLALGEAMAQLSHHTDYRKTITLWTFVSKVSALNMLST